MRPVRSLRRLTRPPLLLLLGLCTLLGCQMITNIQMSVSGWIEFHESMTKLRQSSRKLDLASIDSPLCTQNQAGNIEEMEDFPYLEISKSQFWFRAWEATSTITSNWPDILRSKIGTWAVYSEGRSILLVKNYIIKSTNNFKTTSDGAVPRPILLFRSYPGKKTWQ